MSTIYLLQRNMKWRFQNPLSIFITISQPVLWLFLYGTAAGGMMERSGMANYTAYILPGIMLLVVMAACSSGGMIHYLQKADGSFYRVLSAPVSRAAIVLGQVLESVVCAFLEVLILCLLSLTLDVRFTGGFAAFILVALLVFFTAFFIAAVAYAISLTLPNQVLYEMVMNMIVLPVFFLSSALFPGQSLPGLLKALASVNPLTHVMDAIRRLLMGDMGSYDLLIPVFALLIILSILSFALAFWRLHKKML